jgi:hypothetical protein
MRLRQAHAIIEIAKAVEALDLGFEIRPFHPDFPGNAVSVDGDYMTGFAQFDDPDTRGRGMRTYNIDIRPVLGRFAVTVRLQFGNHGPGLAHHLFETWNGSDDVAPFDDRVAAEAADMVNLAVTRHELPFYAAYLERSGHNDPAIGGAR